MKKKRGKARWSAWQKRVLAAFGTVMLVLSLMPTQGLAEARDEFVALLGAQNEDVGEVVDLSGEANDAEAAAHGEDEFVAAGAQDGENADHDFKFSLDSEWFNETEQIMMWTASFELTARRLSDAKVVVKMPGADLDKDEKVETYDEYMDLYGVYMEGSSDETYATVTNNGIEITFPNGILLDNENKPTVEITFYSRVNSNWYDQGGKEEVHTCTATLSALGKEYIDDASITITKDVEDCNHESFHYEYTDPTYHTICCDNEKCGYRKKEEHHIKKLGEKFTCDCGAFISTVTFDLGEATGSMETVGKVRGFDYQLPSIPEDVVAPEGKVFYGWTVKIGEGEEKKLSPGQFVQLTADTKATAIWNGDVPYVNENQETKWVSDYDMLNANDLDLDKEWYVVSGSLTKNGGYNVVGKNVNIILCDGVDLNVAGILVKAGASLNVFGQTEGSGTITCSSAKAIANFGTTGFYGGKITGAEGEGIYNEAYLTIGGGTITGNGQYGVRHMEINDSSISIKGKPIINNNGNEDSGARFGVYLGGNSKLNVIGSLTDARVSVLVDGQSPRPFTTGYSDSNSGTNPQNIFKSSSGWMVVDSRLDNNEATFYGAVPYIDENKQEQILETYINVKDLLNVWPRTFRSNWYVVRESVDLGGGVSVSGDAKIVLCEGTELKCSGINVKEGNTLTIYGQVKGTGATGKLITNAGYEQAGIGGGDEQKGGRIVICGGHIEATGGEFAAGIGGGDEGSGGAEEIVIYDGNVKAVGGSEGAGIGSGDERSMYGGIYIYGGRVVAEGGWLASGIGGGDDGFARTIVISGNADVKATGGKNAAGIGGGEDEEGGNVTIVGNSCRVEAHGKNGAQGIGRGQKTSKNSGSLNLDDAPLMMVYNDVSTNPCKHGERSSRLRVQDCVIAPCNHKDKTYKITESDHTPQCEYCLLAYQAESTELHDFGYTNVCKTCGAKRVTVEFKPGQGGIGSMDYALPTAGFLYELPKCEYAPPEGKSFYKWEWSVNGRQYAEGARLDIPANVDRITATAVWTEFIPYKDEKNEDAIRGEYTLIEDKSMLSTLSLTDGWYVLKDSMSITNVTVSGEVNLIVCDDARLTSAHGFIINEGSKLNVYGQEKSSGLLNLPETAILRLNNTVITNNGTLNMYGGTLNANSADYGIKNYGTLTLVQGTVENSRSAGVQSNTDLSITLGGRFKFLNNTSSDISLLENQTINVIDELKPEQPIKILLSTDGGVFTKGLKEYNPNLEDPTTIFANAKNAAGTYLYNVYPELTSEGEAEIDSFVYYIDENDKSQAVKSISDFSKNEDRYYNEGWYYVDGLVEFDESLHVNGKVNLVLGDNSTLKVADGIYVAAQENADLHIWWQKGKSGTAIVNTKRDRQAAIGGCDTRPAGSITIHGGNIEATGSANAAAIGGGSESNGGTICILNGNITANGGDNSAAIGGGNGHDGGNITIAGGTVKATGTQNAAAIGGGNGGAGGTIAFTGGVTTAKGGSYAAGVGGGKGAASGTISIAGATVDSEAGKNEVDSIAAEAFGHGAGLDDPGDLSISDITKVTNNGTASVVNDAGDVRLDDCKRQQATASPCEHERSHALSTEDRSGHTIHCSYCAVALEGKKPHEFDDTGTCICGVKDEVTISFDKGEGRGGSMASETAVRNQEYQLPTICTFTPPNSNVSFDRWSIDGKEYLKGETIKPAGDTVVTALWNSLVSYVNEEGKDATVGLYETLVPGMETLDKGWYVLKEDLTLDNVSVSPMAEVHIVLCDNATLTIKDTKGIKTSYGSNLKIFGQRELNNGTITIGTGLTEPQNVINNIGIAALYGGVLDGAADTVLNEGRFTLAGGTIQNGSSSCINNKSTLAVSGGEVVAAKNKTGIINNERGTATITGGSVYGYIALLNRGTAELDGAEINAVSDQLALEACAIENKSKMTIKNAEVSGSGASYLIKNESASGLTIEGGMFTSEHYGILQSSTDAKLTIAGGRFTTDAVCIDANKGTFNLYGNPTFVSKGLKNVSGGISLSEDTVISITGLLDEATNIGIRKSGQGVFTKGFAETNPDVKNPTKYFYNADATDKFVQVCPELTEDGEAEITKFVDYVDEDGNPKVCRDFELLADRIERFNAGTDEARHLRGGWYVADGELTMANQAFDIYNETNIILTDDSILNTMGIFASEVNGAELHIWSQVDATGKLIADASNTGSSGNLAGIGGADTREAGTIVIHGGNIEATGGAHAAGIGGGTSTNGGNVQILNGTVHAKGGENAQAIGRGSDGTDTNKLSLYDSAKVVNAHRVTVLCEDRIDTCRNQEVTIEPCKHDGGYTQTDNGHKIDCKYCLTNIQEEQPHEFNAKGICVCGKQDSVTITFKAGGGKGSMEQITVVRNQPVNLPECTFTAPKEGQGFNKWKYGDTEVMADRPFTPTQDNTVLTALWNEFVPYIDEQGEPATVGTYTNLADDFDKELDSGWYVLKESLTVKTLKPNGQVALVLCDGATLTIEHEDGFNIEGGNTVNIYGQTGQIGRIVSGSSSKDATVIKAEGEVNLYGGIIDGQQKVVDTIEVMGEFNIMGGSVINGQTSNIENKGTVDFSRGAVYGGHYGIMGTPYTVATKLSGKPEFSKDGIRNNVDVYLRTGDVITIDGELSEGVSVNVALQASGKGIFTKGLKENNPSIVDPTSIFSTPTNPNNKYYRVVDQLIEDEAEIAAYIKYVDENNDPLICRNFEILSKRIARYNAGMDDDGRFLKNDWYVVDEDLNVSNAAIDLWGDVNIILVDGKTLTTTGLFVDSEHDATLHVWGQENGTGAIVSNPTYTDLAGIGGADTRATGPITIHGGTITSTGGYYAAGIGCGSFTNKGTVTILGGTITAEGKGGSAAIGHGAHISGSIDLVLGDTMKVTDKSGTVVTSDQRVETCVNTSYAKVEPCKHDDGTSYVSTEEGHSLGCKYCDLAKQNIEKHVFGDDNICTVCGYERVVPVPELKSLSLVLSGQIGLTAFYDLPPFEGYEYQASYVEFAISGKNARTIKVPYDSGNMSKDEVLYGYTCYVDSIELAQQITATLHYGDGLTVVNEGLSVKNYLKSFDEYIQKNPDEFTNNEIELVHAIADYGHYVQPFCSTYNKWKIGSDYSEMDLHYTDSYNMEEIREALSAYSIKKNIEGSKVAKVESSLRLDSETVFDVFISPEEGVDITAEGVFISKDAEVTTISDGRARVRVTGISAHQLGTNVEIAGNAGGEFTISNSALAYANAVVKNSAYGEVGDNAMASFYRYYQRVQAVRDEQM